MAINDEGKGKPAIFTTPYPTKISSPALIRRRCNRGKSLYPGSMTYRPLSDLPALELEDPLDRILVKPEQIGDSSIAKRRLFLDHRLDRFGKGRIDLRRSPSWLVVDAAPGHAEPATKLCHWNIEAFVF